MKRSIYFKPLICFLLVIGPVTSLYAQFPNWGWALPITVSLSGSSITCSVYDPVLAQTKTANYSYASNYINSQGVVAWHDGYNAYVTIYDINLHNFRNTSWSNSTTTFSNFSNTDGMVAWTNSYNTDVAIYDPVLQQWRHTSWSNSTITFSKFVNRQSVVAWANSYNVDVAVYDPSLQQWKHTSYSNSTTTFSNFANQEGIIAWSNSYNVGVSVYDPSLQQWKHNSYSNSTITFSNFINQQGVVVWSNSYNADGAVYDFTYQQWIHSSWSASTITFTSFSVNDGTLNYSNSSTNYQRGYNISSHQWQSNYQTDLACLCFSIATSGPTPLITYFWCLSIGANSYSYSCGDGHTVTNRFAWKQYNIGGTFYPVLTIFNNTRNNTCNSPTISITGIEDIAHPSFQISPNPASDKIVISGMKMNEEIIFYDLLGSEIGTGKGNGTYSIRDFPPVFFVRAGAIVRKVVKE